jgi:hypothetical protein
VFRISKSGVRVYLKPEFHPILKETDLSHTDVVRKAKELFGKRYGAVSGLPRICSKNSEDAMTWGHFSPLLSTSPEDKKNWLEAFLQESLGHELNPNLVKTLPTAELLFWRGKKAEPMYCPPCNLGYPETNTEVDLTILTEKAVIFVEAKYKSEVSIRTTHCQNRDQIIRNIDVGTYYAWKKGQDFYFILVTSPDCKKSEKLFQLYQNNPQNIAERLPHRTDIPHKLEEIVSNLGMATWDQLSKI